MIKKRDQIRKVPASASFIIHTSTNMYTFTHTYTHTYRYTYTIIPTNHHIKTEPLILSTNASYSHTEEECRMSNVCTECKH